MPRLESGPGNQGWGLVGGPWSIGAGAQGESAGWTQAAPGGGHGGGCFLPSGPDRN